MLWGSYGGVLEGEDVREYNYYTLGKSLGAGKAIWVVIERAEGNALMFAIPIFTMKEFKFVNAYPKEFETKKGKRWLDKKVYIHMEATLNHYYTFGKLERQGNPVNKV